MIDLSRFSHETLWPEPPSILAARSQMAMRLSWMTLVLGLGLFAVDRFTGVPATGDNMMTLVLAVMGALSWLLLAFRQDNAMAWLVVAFLFGMAAASVWFFGSVRTNNIMLLPIGQVVAGIALGRRCLVWITFVAIALLGVLTWADAAGALVGQTRFAVSWRTWITQSVSLLGVAAMMYLNRTHIRTAQSLHLSEAQLRLKTQMDRDLGQQQFLRLFESSPTPIFVQSTRTGAILNVNQAFERTLGYARKDVLSLRAGFLWLRDENYQRFVRDRRDTRRTGWHLITVLSRDGKRLSMQICSERDDDPNDGLMITVLCLPGGGANDVLPKARAPQWGVPDA